MTSDPPCAHAPDECPDQFCQVPEHHHDGVPPTRPVSDPDRLAAAAVAAEAWRLGDGSQCVDPCGDIGEAVVRALREAGLMADSDLFVQNYLATKAAILEAEVERLTAAIRTIADTDPSSMHLMDVAQALGNCRRIARAVLDAPEREGRR